MGIRDKLFCNEHRSSSCVSRFASLCNGSAYGQTDSDKIKDSEAIQYVGKEVEVCGQVISVTTSPLGTAFINFGGEYPNQTFAGFVAAGSTIASDQRLTMIQGRIISI